MRSLMIGLFVSVVALLIVAGAMVRHVMRQRQERVDTTGNVEAVLEIEAESQRKAEASHDDVENSALSSKTGGQ